jgi:hypothetical protein
MSVNNNLTSLHTAHKLSDEQLFNQLSFFKNYQLKDLVQHWSNIQQGDNDLSSFQGWGYQQLGSNLNNALHFFKNNDACEFKNKHILDWIENNLNSSLQTFIDDYSTYKNNFQNEINDNSVKLNEIFKELSIHKNTNLIKLMIDNTLISNIMNAGANYSILICDIEDYIFQNSEHVMVLKTNKPYIRQGIKNISQDTILIPSNNTFFVQFNRCYNNGFYLNKYTIFPLKNIFNGDVSYISSLPISQNNNIFS